MRYFPLFVDLSGARAVVVGGAEEALRKVRLLLKTQARIEVIAPELHPELRAEANVIWIADVFLPDMLDGARLVISADEAMNETVSAAAQARGIPVNAVDDAALSTFIIPAIVDRDPVVVAIGTEGAAPVLAQIIRTRINALLPENLGAITRKAAALRDLVAARLPQGKARRNFWADFFFGRVAEAEKTGDGVAYELALGDALFDHGQKARGRISLIEQPADCDDLSVKALRRLMEADVLVAHEGAGAKLFELARRDAVRLDAIDAVAIPVSEGQNVVVVSAALAAARAAAMAQGLDPELFLAPAPSPVAPAGVLARLRRVA